MCSDEARTTLIQSAFLSNWKQAAGNAQSKQAKAAAQTSAADAWKELTLGTGHASGVREEGRQYVWVCEGCTQFVVSEDKVMTKNVNTADLTYW